ncbi:MAG: hypothetical protein JXR96_21630 [Deltaproteobacteria bacterium]|nr:hypothetical protein [Deltaproteobacteria bacterium]
MPARDRLPLGASLLPALLVVCALGWPALCSAGPEEQRIAEAQLVELGAFPVSGLSRPFWDNGHPGQVFSKGERVDVSGWLPPYWARSSSYLTDAQRRALPETPLSPARYQALLDVKPYLRARLPLQHAVIRFALEELYQHGLSVPDKEPVLAVFRARIDLDAQALRVLSATGALAGSDVPALWRLRPEPVLLEHLPVPGGAQSVYRRFLEARASQRSLDDFHRFLALRALYLGEPASRAAELRGFIGARISKVPFWHHRLRMAFCLLDVGDPESLRIAAWRLLEDPVTETREQLLLEIRSRGLLQPFVGAAVLLASGAGEPCREVSINRDAYGAIHFVAGYLSWAKEQPGLAPGLREAIDAVLPRAERMGGGW